MSEVLKRCPFAKCDSAVVMLQRLNGYYVFCRECGTTSPRGYYKTPEEAVAAWNDRAPEPWLPIETAPKDSTRVLACGAIGDSWVGYYTEGWEGEGWYSASSHHLIRITATHWKPLPAPPEGK